MIYGYHHALPSCYYLTGLPLDFFYLSFDIQIQFGHCGSIGS